ncbi:MAG: UpxY family transcription antiterminator [Bacteroidales bacterium]|nr:UpxY family transcription antiterminator [Bacteroidales bacterium]
MAPNNQSGARIDQNVRHWHAIYVRSRAEKKVLSQLEEMGLKAYLPLITKVRQWSDRRMKVDEPLFRSYVFVYSNAKEYIPILNVYGVLKFVSFENQAVNVPENQILAIKKFVADYERGEEYRMQNFEELKEGQLVRIITGPMKGLKGRLESIENKRHLIVYIDVVGQYIPVHLPRAKVEPVYDDEKGKSKQIGR